MINNDFLNEEFAQTHLIRMEESPAIQSAKFRKLMTKDKVDKLKQNENTAQKFLKNYANINNQCQIFTNCEISNQNVKKINNYKRTNATLDLINQFTQYHNDAFVRKDNSNNFSFANDSEKCEVEQKTQNSISHIESNTNAKLSHLYSFASITNNIVYHKTEKWFAYSSFSLIIIENFAEETHRMQKILTHSHNKIISLKLSQNSKILYAITSSAFVFFYAYNSISEEKFTLINKCAFNQSEVIDCEISPRNNISVVITKQSAYFVSVLDFLNNEILVTTALQIDYFLIKWNPYLANLEFTTIAPNAITFWRINTSDGALQYQHANEYNNDDTNVNAKLTSIEFMRPLGKGDIVIMLVGNSKGDVIAYDTKTNAMICKYKGICDKAISHIITNTEFIAFTSDNCLFAFHVDFANAKSTYEDIKTMFTRKSEKDLFSKMAFDSQIIKIDYEHSNNDDIICLTAKGALHYISLQQKSSVKLFAFPTESEKIIQLQLMQKSIDRYRVNDSDCDDNEIIPQIKNDNYYIVTSHDNGAIKIWSVPEYSLVYLFATPNESIITFDVAKSALIFAVSYSSKTIRFFSHEKVIGKFFSAHLSTSASFKYIKFLPDSRYLFLIDESGTMFLINVERFEPLLISYHKVLSIDANVVDFALSEVECYNKFFFNVQNVYLLVYNRKFTNIMKNLNYDNSVPQFYMQDKFMFAEYFKKFVDFGVKINNEKYLVKFTNNFAEKNYIYILSTATKRIIIRNFETHAIENMVTFSDQILNFDIVKSWKYIILQYRKKIQVSEMGKVFNGGIKQNVETLCDSELSLVKKDEEYKLISSENSRIIVLYSPWYIFVYKI